MTSWLGGWRAGSSLAASEWELRHRWIVRAALAQAVVLALLTGALGHGRGPASLVLLLAGLPGLVATGAGWPGGCAPCWPP